ncbi:MAG: hypothetical protein ACOCVA_08580, partial [Prolixibacteraceae bacterium]
MASNNNISVVFDIGTSKIVALAGQKNAEHKMEVLGMANVLSKGIKRGVVFNIEEAAATIEIAREELESQIDEKIKQVDVAFACQHMKVISHRGYKFTSGEGVVT